MNGPTWLGGGLTKLQWFKLLVDSSSGWLRPEIFTLWFAVIGVHFLYFDWIGIIIKVQLAGFGAGGGSGLAGSSKAGWKSRSSHKTDPLLVLYTRSTQTLSTRCCSCWGWGQDPLLKINFLSFSSHEDQIRALTHQSYKKHQQTPISSQYVVLNEFLFSIGPLSYLSLKYYNADKNRKICQYFQTVDISN